MAYRNVQVRSFAEVLRSLGGIPPRRVLTVPLRRHATERDLISLLERKDRICELVDGFLVEKAYGFMESALAMTIGCEMLGAADAKNLGIVLGGKGALRLRAGLIRIPDVSFIEWRQFPGRQLPDEPIPNAYPDLAVEFMRRGNTQCEISRKLREYFEAGTRLAWLVDPRARTVQAFTAPDQSTTLTEKDTLDGGDVLPGFHLALKELFARVPRSRKNGSPRRKSS